MYKALKDNIVKFVPKKFIFNHEETLRSLYAVFYSGSTYQCNVCNKKLKNFITLPNQDLLCPKCGSLKRNRRLWSFLEKEFLVVNSTVLDFSPSRCLYRKLKNTPTIHYKPTDLSGDFISDFQYDITKLLIENDSIDLIVCYHILEHIVDDIQAMKELFRVLKPGGKALVQTPFKEGEIYEDYSIITNIERLNHFGQEDHVRIYSILGLKKRLESCGFEVEIRSDFIENKFNGFESNEEILVLTKPICS